MPIIHFMCFLLGLLSFSHFNPFILLIFSVITLSFLLVLLLLKIEQNSDLFVLYLWRSSNRVTFKVNYLLLAK